LTRDAEPVQRIAERRRIEPLHSRDVGVHGVVQRSDALNAAKAAAPGHNSRSPN
jgi:hypothetical protein